MPIIPGITQAASLLNNLFRQGEDPAQAMQTLTDPEAIVSPADPYQRAGHDPVLEEVATVGVSGTDVPPAPPERYIEAVWNNYSPIVDSNWEQASSSNTDFAVNDGVMTITYKRSCSAWQSSAKRSNVAYSMRAGDIFYTSFMLNTETEGQSFTIFLFAQSRVGAYMGVVANTNQLYHGLIVSNANGQSTSSIIGLAGKQNTGNDVGKKTKIWAPLIVNLTKMFGAGNEPTLTEFEAQCALNNIDLTQQQAYNLDGTAVQWRIE